jgi:hypothetical protein
MEERYYCLVEGRFVGRRVVVAFAGCEACGGDLRKKARDLLVGRVGFPIEDQDWHIDGAERLGRPYRSDRTANHRRKDLRVRARNSSRDETGGGEVPRSDFSPIQDLCSFLCPHLAGNRSRYGIGNRPVFGKVHHGLLDDIVADSGENGGLHRGRVQHEQAGRCAAPHRETDDVGGVQSQVLDERDDIFGHREIGVSFPFAGLVRCAEAAHVGQDGPGTGGAQGMRKAGSTFGGRIRQRKRPAENLAKHLLPFFEYRKYALEVSELTQCVDSESMQQDNGRAFALVVVGNAESVEGCECVQSGPQKSAAVEPSGAN